MKPKNEIIAASRLAQIPETIFTTMSRLAVEYRAVNLGQGFPDFDGPSWIIDGALKAMKEGKNQYAPMHGTLTMRRAVAAYQKEYYDLDWDVETGITVTAGATEALFSATLALIEPGDEVILFEPYYDSHHANVTIAGGTPKCVTLRKPDFRFDPSEIEQLISTKTKMIILNNPNNPTGKVFTKRELETIAELAVQNNLIILSDEVYEFLTYDDAHHIPISTLPGMRNRTITVSSTGKTFGMTGWKIGFALASQSLTDAIRKVHQFATFAVNTPGQHAMGIALTRLREYLPDFRKMYEHKRNLLMDGLRQTAFTPYLPHGSYFIMASIPDEWNEDDVQCALRLVKETGVATIPTSVFYSNSREGKTMLRFCFAKRDETIHEGVKRLSKR